MSNNFTEADYKDQERLWTRIGDAGDYENFGDDLASLIDYLNDCKAGQVTGWKDDGVGIGIGMETVNYHGFDFISIYWGDCTGDFIRVLDAEERAVVEERLEEVYN
jgi:hypothetical protein